MLRMTRAVECSGDRGNGSNGHKIPKTKMKKKPCHKRKSEASALLDGLYEPVGECDVRTDHEHTKKIT